MISISVITSLNGQSGTMPLEISKFPCGESKITLDWMSLPQNMLFEQLSVKLKYESDQDLINLLLVVDAVKRSGLRYKNFSLLLGYFPYGRQDRVCEVGEPHSLKVVCSLINSCGFDSVYVIDPHSDVIEALLDNPVILTQSDVVFTSQTPAFKEYDLYVSPDAGAYKKVTKSAKVYNKEIVRADKIRDTKTGNIVGTEVYSSNLNGRSVLILDDIIDGGRSFIELAKKLKEKGAGKVGLYTSFGMFTKGVDVLKENIDELFCYEYYGPSGDKHKVTMLELYNG